LLVHFSLSQGCFFVKSNHFVLLGAAALAAIVLGQNGFAQPALAPLPPHSSIQDKNFYLFSAVERNSKVGAALADDGDLARITAERRNALAFGLRSCKTDAACLIKAFLWTDEEIHAVSIALQRIAGSDPAVSAFVENDVRSSGNYILFENQPAGELLSNAWETCARGLNNVIAVYGQGLPPRYPMIDSASVDLKSSDFQQRFLALAVAESGSGSSPLFYLPSLQVALELLGLNHRDESARHEPMETGVNAAAIDRIAAQQERDYPYSIIVVPGAGSADPDTPLSPMGRKRCALAADAYHAGKAPFVLVSGGYVHPAQTRYAEAIEMKRSLIADFGVPESAILVDPHARHTTTNMRNAAREIFRYHISVTKPALAISDASQIANIASEEFADRCLKELGYLPYRIVRRESDTAVAFVPLVESLEQDPMDPLDP
jgi:uncharacterized SAM-binding protein YcdF (DUF218 family)